MSTTLNRQDFTRALILLYEDPNRARTSIDGDSFEAGVIAACRAMQAEVMPSSCGPNGRDRSNHSGVAGYSVSEAFMATMGNGNRQMGVGGGRR